MTLHNSLGIKKVAFCAKKFTMSVGWPKVTKTSDSNNIKFVFTFHFDKHPNYFHIYILTPKQYFPSGDMQLISGLTTFLLARVTSLGFFDPNDSPSMTLSS